MEVDFSAIGTHRLEPTSKEFVVLRNSGTIARKMHLFVILWANTVHKMRGSTVDHAVVYLGDKLF